MTFPMLRLPTSNSLSGGWRVPTVAISLRYGNSPGYANSRATSPGSSTTPRLTCQPPATSERRSRTARRCGRFTTQQPRLLLRAGRELDAVPEPREGSETDSPRGKGRTVGCERRRGQLRGGFAAVYDVRKARGPGDKKGGGVSERERRELEGSGSYTDSVSVDPESQQRELEEAGWKPIERMGKIVWQRPDSHYLYPQGVAIRMVREAAENESEGNIREILDP